MSGGSWSAKCNIGKMKTTKFMKMKYDFLIKYPNSDQQLILRVTREYMNSLPPGFAILASVPCGNTFPTMEAIQQEIDRVTEQSTNHEFEDALWVTGFLHAINWMR